MVFVSGMFIATKHATRRNQMILMLSLALGIGVAMEPNLFEGGGVASFYGKNLQHNTGFWPRYKTCKTFPVDSETGALVRTCTNNNGACCSVQKPKFHGVRRPTHRLISTQVLLRVRQGRGLEPDDGDHPLEDALRHRLRRGPLPAPPLARGQGGMGRARPGRGVKRAPACPYAHPASSAQPPKARARHGNKPPIRRLTPCYISPTHNLDASAGRRVAARPPRGRRRA